MYYLQLLLHLLVFLLEHLRSCQSTSVHAILDVKEMPPNDEETYFLVGTLGLDPFDALGTLIPFLTPVVGALLPEIPMPPVAEAPIPELIVVFFILSG